MNTNPVDEDLCANVIFNYFQCKFSGHIFNVILVLGHRVVAFWVNKPLLNTRNVECSF